MTSADQQPIDVSTSAPNLFAAARSYFLAARTLLNQSDGLPASVAMPFYFLSGFAIELALKAVVFRVSASEPNLRRIGHDLTKALKAAEMVGLTSADPDLFKMVQRMSVVHKELTFRYVPDVEHVIVIGPRLLDSLIARLVMQIETEFDVWGDQPQGQPLVQRV